MKSLIIAFIALLTATGAFAQSNYRVSAGDVIRIEVLEDPNLNREVLVLPDGRFSFPFAGSVSAGGRTLSQIQSAIAESIAPNFANTPNVFASVATLREDTREDEDNPFRSVPGGMNVYFLGEVNSPGLIPMKRGTTFLQAMAQNGGFTAFAAKKRIQLRRTNRKTGVQTVTTINYRSIANGASLSRNIVLHDGDVILVPERRLFE